MIKRYELRERSYLSDLTNMFLVRVKKARNIKSHSWWKLLIGATLVSAGIAGMTRFSEIGEINNKIDILNETYAEQVLPEEEQKIIDSEYELLSDEKNSAIQVGTFAALLSVLGVGASAEIIRKWIKAYGDEDKFRDLMYNNIIHNEKFSKFIKYRKLTDEMYLNLSPEEKDAIVGSFMSFYDIVEEYNKKENEKMNRMKDMQQRNHNSEPVEKGE